MISGTKLWTPNRTFAFAKFAHYGQLDKSGGDYFEMHVYDVYHRVMRSGGSPEAQTVALLHDAAEDWPAGYDSMIHALGQLHMPPAAFIAIRTINKRPGRSNQAYWAEVRNNELALLVKEHDINSNTNPVRTARLDPKDRERLAKKYRDAREALGIDLPKSVL